MDEDCSMVTVMDDGTAGCDVRHLLLQRTVLTAPVLVWGARFLIASFRSALAVEE